ncbi:hypothetical protein C5S32_07370 [ANME-1 cluster archaeon GoMg1]|nr:hypothetical protein [ANME-1 cluster archaeon GoMg1]
MMNGLSTHVFGWLAVWRVIFINLKHLFIIDMKFTFVIKSSNVACLILLCKYLAYLSPFGSTAVSTVIQYHFEIFRIA